MRLVMVAAGLASWTAAAAAAQVPNTARPAVAAAVVAPPASSAGVPVGVARAVPVAVRAMPRGTTLTPADFALVDTIVRASLRTAAAAESGWVTRRVVAAGEPLVEPTVGPPALVLSGQPVTFVADHAGIRLSIRGTAASTGALGDRVWVRTDARRRLRGIVIAPSTIRADTTALR